MHRARAYKGSKLGPEKQARQNPKVGFGIGPVVRLYKNRSKRNTGGKCSICSDKNTFKLNTITKLKTKLQVINYITIFLNDIKYKININAKILIIKDDSYYLKAYPDIRSLIGIVNKVILTKYYPEAKLK